MAKLMRQGHTIEIQTDGTDLYTFFTAPGAERQTMAATEWPDANTAQLAKARFISNLLEAGWLVS